MNQRPDILTITLVVAATLNGVIGDGGTMPWRMPSSLRRFRMLTLGRPMIMGRKTFQSIGRALDGRDTVVVTRSATFQADGVHTTQNLTEAFVVSRGLAAARGVDEIVVAGGGEIYRAALPCANRVHLDLLEVTLAGDTTFPDLDPTEWRETERHTIPAMAGDAFAATALRYDRITPPRALPGA